VHHRDGGDPRDFRDHVSSGEVKAIDPSWLTDKGKREVAAGRRIGMKFR
jgi:hypothetical protein